MYRSPRALERSILSFWELSLKVLFRFARMPQEQAIIGACPHVLRRGPIIAFKKLHFLVWTCSIKCLRKHRSRTARPEIFKLCELGQCTAQIRASHRIDLVEKVSIPTGMRSVYDMECSDEGPAELHVKPTCRFIRQSLGSSVYDMQSGDTGLVEVHVKPTCSVIHQSSSNHAGFPPCPKKKGSSSYPLTT